MSVAEVRERIADARVACVGETGAIGIATTPTSGTVDADRIASRAAIFPGRAAGIAVGSGANIPGGAAGSGADADAVATAIHHATILCGVATRTTAHLRLGTAKLFADANRSVRATRVVTALRGGSAAIGPAGDAGRTDAHFAIPDLLAGT